MTIILNGGEREVDEGTTAAQAVRLLTAAASGVAAAVNGQVVTRAAWENTVLADGDIVEVLTAVQGG